MSKPSREAIRSVLAKRYTRVDITLVDTLEDLEALVNRKPDLVFLGMKFVPLHPEFGLQDTNRAWVSDYLDENDIAYTGSSQVAHELDCDKTLAKQCVADAGHATSPFHIIVQGQQYTADDISLPYPLFVKPTNRGGGLGVDNDSVVHNFSQLRSKVDTIAKVHKSHALIERYLPGREFSVAILKNPSNNQYSIMPVELIAEVNQNGQRILGGAVKSANTEQVTTVTEPLIKSKLDELAMYAFIALGARDYGRIDIRLDCDGEPQFLEANLIPSLIKDYGTFPKAYKMGFGLEYESIIHTITELAILRSEEANQPSYQLIGNQQEMQSARAYNLTV